MNNLNLIDLDKKNKEAYEEADKHSDCQFFKLPLEAQEEALRIIAEHDNPNVISRELDRSTVFRGAFEERLQHKGINVFDSEFYLQAVDSVMRYVDFIRKCEVVA